MGQGLPTRLPAGAGPRAWWGALVFAAAALYLFPFWQRVGLDSDEGKIILGSLRVLQGERLYVDVFEFLPPGLYALVAGVLRLTRPAADIYWLRLVVILLGAGTVVATWGVAVRGTGRPLLALVPALWALVCGLSHWCIANAHWVSTTCAMFATWAMMEIGAVRAPWRPWFLTGLGLGATTLFAHHKGIALAGVAAVLAVVYIVHAVRRLDRPASRLVGPEDAAAFGFVLVVAPLLIGLAVRGQLVPMLQASFGWTVEGYSVANRVPYGYLAPLLFAPERWLLVGPAVGRVLGWIVRLFLLFLAPACLALLLGRGAWQWHRRAGARAWTDMTVGFTGLAMWGTTLTRPDVLHLLTVGPWLFLAPVMLLAPPPGVRLRPPTLWLGRAGAAVAVVVALVWGIGDHLEVRRWSTLRLGGLGLVRYPHDVAPDFTLAESPYAQTVAFLESATLEDEPIFVYPYAPYIYYLAGRTNPTRFNICFPGYQGEAAIAEVIDVLETQAVPYVVLDPMSLAQYRRHAFPGYDPALFDESPLTQYIARRYQEVQRFGDFRVLKRKAG